MWNTLVIRVVVVVVVVVVMYMCILVRILMANVMKYCDQSKLGRKGFI